MANSFVKNVEDFVRSHIIAAFVGSGILLVAGVALRPLAEGHGLFAFDTFVWAIGVVFCALLVVIVSTYLRELLLALAAMWKPLLVVGAGFLFLILNDQGRELGVSLMDESGSPWSARRLALFLALIYWAVKLGIRRGLVWAAPFQTRMAARPGFTGRRGCLASAPIFSPRSICLWRR